MLTSLEQKLYAKFERSGKRPPGSACHELLSFTGIFALVIVPAALLMALPRQALFGDAYPPPPTAPPPIAPDAPQPPPAPWAPPPCTVAALCQGQQAYAQLEDAVSYAFTVGWPAAWAGLRLASSSLR